MERPAEIERRLATVPDPVALLAGIFAFAPVGFQIYRADGHSLLTNQAFREMFGSEPPPEYNVLEDEIAARTGVLELIRRSFAGETISTPTVWYDPRELEQVQVEQGRRVAMSTTFFPLRDAAGQVSHVAVVFKDQTRETLAAERAASLLSVASALSEASTFAEVVRAIAVESQKAAHAEDAVLLALDDARALAAAGDISPRIDQGRAILPLVSRGRALAVLQLSLPRAAELAPEDREWLATLARLCAEAYERASIVDARRRDTEAAADRARFLATASAALGESLDLAETLQRICDLCVPRLGDFALIDLPREGGMERVASARSEEVRGALLELARLGVSVAASQQSIEDRQPRIFNDIDEAALRASATSDEHLRLALRIGGRAYATCPMMVRGRPVGALGVGRTEPGNYAPDELILLQDLAHRAGLAIDSARLYAEAQREVRLREDFLSVAGHELRTPLTALLLQVQTMRRKLGKPDADMPALHHAAEVAERQVRRLTALVQQLLDVSRLQAGRLELDPEQVDLRELAVEVVERFEAAAAITVRAPEAKLVGRWDRLRLDQIVTNLLSNAVRYGQGKPIDVELERAAGKAILRVRDRGIGIAPEDQKRIFERFERAAPVRHYGGVGLGLWIVGELVRAMGGSVALESAKDLGAMFTIELPL